LCGAEAISLQSAFVLGKEISGFTFTHLEPGKMPLLYIILEFETLQGENHLCSQGLKTQLE